MKFSINLSAPSVRVLEDTKVIEATKDSVTIQYKKPRSSLRLVEAFPLNKILYVSTVPGSDALVLDKYETVLVQPSAEGKVEIFGQISKVTFEDGTQALYNAQYTNTVAEISKDLAESSPSIRSFPFGNGNGNGE